MTAISVAADERLGILDRLAAAMRTAAVPLPRRPSRRSGRLGLAGPSLALAGHLAVGVPRRTVANSMLHAGISRLPDSGNVGLAPGRHAGATEIGRVLLAAALAAAPIVITLVLASLAASGLVRVGRAVPRAVDARNCRRLVLAVLAASRRLSPSPCSTGWPPLRRAAAAQLGFRAAPRCARDPRGRHRRRSRFRSRTGSPEREAFVDERRLRSTCPPSAPGERGPTSSARRERVAAVLHRPTWTRGRTSCGSRRRAAPPSRASERRWRFVRGSRSCRRRGRGSSSPAWKRGAGSGRTCTKAHGSTSSLSLELQMLRSRVDALWDPGRVGREAERCARGAASSRAGSILRSSRTESRRRNRFADRPDAALGRLRERAGRAALPRGRTAGYFVRPRSADQRAAARGVPHASVRVVASLGRWWSRWRTTEPGGADPSLGSGLRELEDRLAALDGTLTVVARPTAGRGSSPGSPPSRRPWLP